MFRSLISLTLVIAYVSALAFPGARPTAAAELDGQVFPPEPTAGTVFPQDLLRRSLLTDLLAPDNTCGFISGLPGAAYTCNPSTDLCLFFQGTSQTPGAVGCCDSNFNCGARVTCVDRQAYLSSNICDNGCEKDTYTLKCTQSSAPYCNSITFPSQNVQDYFCDDTAVKSWQTAFTTYNNYKGTRVFSPITLTNTPSSATTQTSAASAQGITTSTSTGGTAVTVPATATSASGTSVVPVPVSGSSTPVGPIVGGVVGGVAGIALICAAIIFFMRSRSKKNNASAAVAGGNALVAPPTYAPPDSNNSAYAAAAAGKPAPTPQETSMGGVYGPPQTQTYQYQPVPQQYPPEMQQYPGMAEVEGNNYQHVPQNLTAGYGQQQAQTPPQPYYSPHPSGQISPNSQAHLSAALPDRNDTTSPMSDHRVSQIAISEAPSSPAPTFASHTPAPQSLAPVVEGRHEMSANLAGPFPSNLHDGTYEVPGSSPHQP